MKYRLLIYLLLPALAFAGLVAAPKVQGQEIAFRPFNVPVPEPRNLDRFVADRAAAIQLGKALFWDMQLGSDGMTACATCHHHAGTDSRVRNTLHPGVDGMFHDGRANTELTMADFPFVRFADPDDADTRLDDAIRNDRVGTQGVNRTRLLDIVEGQAEEPGVHVRDTTFVHNARNVRQNTPRTAPTVINAVFNFTNFWDGRANHFFNGVDPFGPLNRDAVVYRNVGGTLQPISLTADIMTNEFALDNASLASQAVGPPLDTGEMSWIGRTWPDIGKKMLSLRPLARQVVHAQDSALGALVHSSGRGLNTSYDDLVRAAFHAEFWDGPDLDTGYSHMAQNFSLFFGLAVQLYQTTLIADQSPFDFWSLDPDQFPLPVSADEGRNRFFNNFACTACHVGPELTGASVRFAEEEGIIELMRMGDNQFANYDIGFYNIGVTPTNDDLGRGRNAPPHITLTNGDPMPLAFSHQFFVGEELLGFPPLAQPGCINDFLDEPPTICDDVAIETTRVAVNGAFKTPGLRNIELTGPYMHDGGMVTLMQVVDFYARGGNFHEENLADLDPEMDPIGTLRGTPERKRELVDFMLSLTDERVRWERAPFDHPQLFIPDGHGDLVAGNPKHTRILVDNMVEIPAVGRGGREAEGLPPLRPFLAPEDYDPNNRDPDTFFHYQP